MVLLAWEAEVAVLREILRERAVEADVLPLPLEEELLAHRHRKGVRDAVALLCSALLYPRERARELDRWLVSLIP